MVGRRQRSTVLKGVDGRTLAARRYRDLVAGFRHDLGRHPSTAEQALIAQAAALVMQRERLAAEVAAGRDADPRAMVRLAGALGRTLRELGLSKPPKPAAPSLREHLAARAAEKGLGA